ncbi:hypothetical protein [Candidatus Phytoplasma solani]|uniref:Uncharacterized protein n=1 Tax=Candidatus Phytoplasma solani TaxID=69896 RepID=A0A421NX55_9MOLU|nr:hypothetical protein [Candidatus Phytoplasma solani]RMI88623.1 hypothetical protein PSSA1_v1c4460 [Candidatus Phytoplasma solani]CCP88431.1 conserved hypothetical protein [Candidatus Phytoplasma solani]
MRILPYELYQYAPDLSLCALRKEFGMYDYCLNKNIKNQGMQPFLDMGRNYFNLSFNKWILEMNKRGHYVNTFHSFYSHNIAYKEIETNFFLILECCIQWEIKQFLPYENNLSWYQIAFQKINSNKIKNNFNFTIYQKLMIWYKNHFIQLNKKGLMKPNKLNMASIISFFSNQCLK